MRSDVPAPPAGAARRRLADGRDDLLIREEPLHIDVHGRRLLTMRTPGRDEDLALGFLLGEGIVQAAADVSRIECAPGSPTSGEPDTVAVTLRTPPTGSAGLRLSRTHEVRSSCGACGAADFQALLDDTPALLPGVPRVPASSFGELVARLAQRQELFSLTGGCHGALLADAHGSPLARGEDVGRHNALDKAIGQAARAGVEFARSIAVLSGRSGFDLVTKCLRVRIPIIVSVSAPSALAFDLCHAAGATLVGFVRGDDFEVYCGESRLAGA